MRAIHALLPAAMLGANLLAQPVSNPPPSNPPSTPAVTVRELPAAAVPASKPPAAAPAPAPALPPVQLVKLAPGAATITANHVNVRARPSFRGEILTRLGEGDAVTVLDSVIIPRAAADEPAQWAKIALPANVPAWVFAEFVDLPTRTVKVKKLNVRGGPGENFSVIGTLEQGATVRELITEIGAAEGWLQIVPPEGTYAFVAAEFLAQEGAAPAPTSTQPAPSPPATTPATNPPPTAPAPTPAPDAAPPPTPAPPTATNAPPPPPPPVPALEVPAPAPPEGTPPPTPAKPAPPQPRIVTREGYVWGTLSIQAPTYLGLMDVRTRRLVNYLQPATPDLQLKRYVGQRVLVTGEEGLDKRWPNTPVLMVQKLTLAE